MQCTCIEVDCDDPCQVISQKVVKARKAYQCCECRETINIGDEYEHYTGTHEGSIFHHKTCKDCVSLRDAYFCNYYFGDVWELFRQHVYESNGEVCLEPMEKLTPRAKAKACEVIDEFWREEDE